MQVVAYDATAEAIELMNKGVVSAGAGAEAVRHGLHGGAVRRRRCRRRSPALPRRVETGFAIIDKDNVADPNFSRFIYKVGNWHVPNSAGAYAPAVSVIPPPGRP